MNDFDEKLNSLLSNPEAMGQIFQLAQSLSGTTEPPPPPPQPPPQPIIPSNDNSILGGINAGTLMRLLPLIQELGEQNGNARNLLLAMRPYLKPERQSKVEQALQLSRLICVGRKFLKDREG